MMQTSINIYSASRKGAGITQETAAQLLCVSVRCLADYETSQRVPSIDTVERMAEIYEDPSLVICHIRRMSPTAESVLPPEQYDQGLPESALQLIGKIYSFADKHRDRQLIEIAADGVIDASEREAFDQIVEDLQQIIQSAFAVSWAKKEPCPESVFSEHGIYPEMDKDKK